MFLEQALIMDKVGLSPGTQLGPASLFGLIIVQQGFVKS